MTIIKKASLVRPDVRDGGGRMRLVLDRPKGNILSREMLEALRRALVSSPITPGVKLLTIEGAGDHFSYGASVEEHTPQLVRPMLTALHGVIRDLLEVDAPTAAIVRGRCLGGGLEIALACDVIFAADTAMLGVPEIGLGVFPPAAAALLPLRVGISRAARVVLTGEALSARWWQDAGLIDVVAQAKELDRAVDTWFATHLAGRSAAALRHAAAATRVVTRHHLDRALPELEHLYLDQLMNTDDAREGIAAFIEKRPPRWSDA